MKIYVVQVYVEPGASYPFSHRFQKYVTEELTKLVATSETFIRRFAEDFKLIFYISAKAAITAPEVKGPRVVKKDKTVEFTIFLPFNKVKTREQDTYRSVLGQFICQVVNVLRGFEIDTSQLAEEADAIIERVLSDPTMIDAD